MLTIIDYNAGNLTSVRLAFEALGAEAKVVSDAAGVAAADRLVFPGVGAAAAAMDNLRRAGLDTAIRAAIAAGVPFLGICLGTQILFERSDEDGGTETLGILPGTVRRLAPTGPRAKIPHMGWNQTIIRKKHPVLDSIRDGSDFYFVHSYYVAPANGADILCETEYAGQTFTSAVARGNVVATQFHSEKSGRTGLRLLENFLHWNGKEPVQC